jgi:hypothetical protein
MMHLELLVKKEEAKTKTSRCREIKKIRTLINETETKKLYTESIKQEVGSSIRLLRLKNP